MAFSLYYTAIRSTPLTAEESAEIRRIADTYCKSFPLKGRAEDFCIYLASDGTEIFSGATALPGGGYKRMYEAALHWLKALTDIRNALSGCVWDVRFDDVDLIWEESTGWRFPTDEEYAGR